LRKTGQVGSQPQNRCIRGMDFTLNSGILLQKQHQKETAAPDTEFIVLPPNTQAKHVPTSYGVVNVQQFKGEYENEISAILFTPSLSDSGSGAAAQNTGTSAAASTAPQSTAGTQYRLFLHDDWLLQKSVILFVCEVVRHSVCVRGVDTTFRCIDGILEWRACASVFIRVYEQCRSDPCNTV